MLSKELHDKPNVTEIISCWWNVTTGGFWEKKKKTSGACTPLCHTDFILACHAKFLISINEIWSMIQSVVQFVVQSVIQSDQIQVFSTLLNGETPNPQYPVCMFSILFSIHFPRCWQGEFVKQSRASSKRDHFLCSSDFNLCNSEVIWKEKLAASHP